MKFKFRMLIILSSFIIVQPTYIIAYNRVNDESATTIPQYNLHNKKGHKVHINVIHSKKRNVISSHGYIEENSLYLYFSSPLENVSLEITNENTGTLIFSGEFTGTSLVIPIQEDGYEFVIDINN